MTGMIEDAPGLIDDNAGKINQDTGKISNSTGLIENPTGLIDDNAGKIAETNEVEHTASGRRKRSRERGKDKTQRNFPLQTIKNLPQFRDKPHQEVRQYILEKNGVDIGSNFRFGSLMLCILVILVVIVGVVGIVKWLQQRQERENNENRA